MKKYFFFILTIVGCNSNKKEIVDDCHYSLKEHKLLINDSIHFKTYIDEYGFNVYDEKKDGIGSVYYFYKNKLHEYIYYIEDTNWTYAESYDSLGRKFETLGEPLVGYTFTYNDKNQMTLHLTYFALNKRIYNTKIKHDVDSTLIKVFKFDNHTNLLYSKVFLKRHNKKNYSNFKIYNKL